jgi:anion-transporting  ArsA/GET3 family ATPase
MQALLDRKLLFITGKGGVGKSTLAAAIATLQATRGRRVIVVEVGDQSRLQGMFGRAPAPAGVEVALEPYLSSISIDPDLALLEWLQALGGRISGRILASSGTFQYFAAAAPGARELVSMVKIARLTRGGDRKRQAGYDMVVVDAPATGHALGLLGSPQTFGAIARVGPIAGQTRQLQELLEDPAGTGYLAVALGTEMAVTETLELNEGLGSQLGRELDAVIVNGLLPRRFTTAELDRIDVLAGNGHEHLAAQAGKLSAVAAGGAGAAAAPADLSSLASSAARAARAAHERARFQHNQLARLRRRSFEVLGVPFVWGAKMDLASIRAIGERLGRKL